MKGILNSEKDRRGRDTREMKSQIWTKNLPLLSSNYLFVHLILLVLLNLFPLNNSRS